MRQERNGGGGEIPHAKRKLNRRHIWLAYAHQPIFSGAKALMVAALDADTVCRLQSWLEWTVPTEFTIGNCFHIHSVAMTTLCRLQLSR